MNAQYWTYAAMWRELRRLAGLYPRLMTVEVIGQSREGRDMAGVTLTNRDTGDAASKSALFVDANIHAGEVAGNAVAMYWIAWCLENYGKNPEATWLLDDHTVYVVPRISLDGAELYLTTPHHVRSSPHIYPYSTPPDGFVEEDVNGDGYILMMRVPSSEGGFVIDDLDPRVMRPRRPGERGGQYYHLFPEGRIDQKTQSGSFSSWAHARPARRQGMDFNRNFPIRWAGEKGQPGAGPYPLSEPELRHLTAFIHRHGNVAAYVALHTSGGVILRQPSTGEDATLSETDRLLFTRIADMGAEVSGYFADSNYHIFATGHEKVLMPGAADDWMYDHFGVLSFTLEIWNLPKHAGARGYAEYGVRKLMELKPEEETEDDRKIIDWVSREVPEQGFFAWTPFDHPDFGRVEIGGLNPKFVVQNPPPALLEEECAHVSAFLTKLGLSTPRLELREVKVEEQAPGLYRIAVEVVNSGYLPTSSTAKGRELLLEGLKASISGDVRIVAGTTPAAIGHLDGYGAQDGWAPPHGQRGAAEWMVQGASGTQVEVVVDGPRAGRVAATVVLGKE
ncbi:M14 family metallopeptidase [Sulfobacillus harzensis]|uniref:Peptidase M14 n=1 Tax=Sulfobacillus harzensis TaxID=2729629 RepID=A0A7Y0L127_9FIRM|nr:M14 family metallopeptidase [Sulfobacillus harzensis]NMP21327.1 peptidase M14 [Sulfobacillus harzensis]